MNDDETMNFIIKALDALGDRFADKNRYHPDMEYVPMDCHECECDMMPWRSMYEIRGRYRVDVWKCPKCGAKRSRQRDIE